jgi:hypothetical protein
VVRAPGQEPRLHVFMPDVMPELHLAVGLTSSANIFWSALGVRVFAMNAF